MGAELAAEMLAGLSPAVRLSNGRATGSDGLIGCELAGAMRGLGPSATALIVAKYIEGCTEVQSREFYDLFTGPVSDLAVDGGWSTAEFPGALRRMLVLGLYELMHPRRCRSCAGTQHVDARPCPACQGSGTQGLSGRYRASVVGIPDTSWRRVWARRYDMLLARLHQIEGDALAKVWRQMRRE